MYDPYKFIKSNRRSIKETYFVSTNKFYKQYKNE